MGRNTKNFRQTARSRSGNRGAQAYAQTNRTVWHARVFNYIKEKCTRG